MANLVKPKHPGIILAFLCIAGFMTFLDVSIVNVSLPTIGNQLHVSERYLQYIVTTFGIILGGFLLLSGRLADIFGRRRLLMIGLIVFATASLMAGFSGTVGMLIVARGLQGLGAAFITPAALGLLTTVFTERAARTKALGVWGGMSGMASVAGVILGGVLTQGPGWRWIFFINVPIGIVAAALAPFILPESRNVTPRKSFDLTGAIALTAGLVLLVFTLGQMSSWGWAAPSTIVCFGIVAALLLTFVLIERRVAEPLMPLALFRHRTLSIANVVALFMLGTLTTLFFFASLFMQQVLGYSPLTTGLAYLPIAIIISVGAGISQALVRKFPAKPILISGLALAFGGVLLLTRLPLHGHYLVDILPAFLTAGLGIGLSFVPLQVAAFHDAEVVHAGVAAGLINTSQEVGGALGIATAATIAFSRIPALTAWAAGNPGRILISRASVFHEALLVGAGFAFIAILIALLLPRLAPEPAAN